MHGEHREHDENRGKFANAVRPMNVAVCANRVKP
jgi:hypothetical protein